MKKEFAEMIASDEESELTVFDIKGAARFVKNCMLIKINMNPFALPTESPLCVKIITIATTIDNMIKLNT